MPESAELWTYRRSECVVFLKTHEAFGGLSNMAAGYPLRINGVRILTSEALYQACRFPHLPTVQQDIIDQASPMAAKMRSKPYRPDSRSGFDEMRKAIMDWCLKVKLAQNWEKFGALLQSTEDKDIVEESRRDLFWGAIPMGSDALQGMNSLGRLLSSLREQLRSQGDNLLVVTPPDVGEFLLLGRPIGTIDGRIRQMRKLADPDEIDDEQAPEDVTRSPAVNRPSLPQQGRLWRV